VRGASTLNRCSIVQVHDRDTASVEPFDDLFKYLRADPPKALRRPLRLL
jgi:hypothetical protein